jgi:hypothetical protein
MIVDVFVNNKLVYENVELTQSITQMLEKLYEINDAVIFEIKLVNKPEDLIMNNSYTEGEYAGILSVVQLQHRRDKWKEEYEKLLIELGKSPDDVLFWVDYFFLPRS